MPAEDGLGPGLHVVLLGPGARAALARDLEGRGYAPLDEPFAGLDDRAATDRLRELTTESGPVVVLTSTPRVLLWLRPLGPDLVTVHTTPPVVEHRVPAAARITAADVLHVVLPLVALALWCASVGSTDLRAMDDLGLIGVLPAPTLAAMALVSVSFALSLRRPRPAVALLHLGVLVLLLFGVATVTADVPRLNVSWRHAGVTEQIARTALVDRSIDAYFNWPGFFVLLGALTELAGFGSALRFASWAPVYFNLFYLLPLWAIVGRVTDDARLRWLTLWVFLLTNWVNQDYLAPQAFALAGFLTIVALVAGWLDTDRDRDRAGPRPARAAVGALLTIVTIFVVMVPSHQITPLAAAAAVVALVVVRRCRTWTLPVILGVVAVAWISLATEPFLAGRIHDLVESVGDLSRSANANVGERLRGSPEHVFVVRLRLAMTAGLWGLAALGALRRRNLGRWDLAIVALAVAPFPLLAFQPYGGEMLLRVYLFGLAFVAVLVAMAAFPAPDRGRSWFTTAALAVGLVVMTAGFLVARYGNERINQFTHAEVAAVDELYDRAPPGSLIVAGSGNLPWRSRAYAEMDYSTLLRVEQDRGRAEPRLEDLLSVVQQRRDGCAFVIISRAELAYVDLLGVWPRGSLRELRDELRGSPFFDVAFANEDAVIFVPSRRLSGDAGAPERADDGGAGAAVGCRR